MTRRSWSWDERCFLTGADLDIRGLFLEIGIIVPKTLFVDSILDKEPIFQPCVSLTQAMVIFREFSVNPARLMYPKEV
jgi:hypothetical protein